MITIHCVNDTIFKSLFISGKYAKGESIMSNDSNLGDETVGFHFEQSPPSQLIVVTFDDEDQAQGLHDELIKLDKQKIIQLKDTVFVIKNEDGELEKHETAHHEKRTGTISGGVIGGVIGIVLGGPIIGLAGGSVIGRWIGKKMDLGVDEGTIQSISDDLNEGQIALFILGSAEHAATIIETFRHYHGTIVSTTLDTEMHDRLQKALDADN
jgi:uncharacterized membrane protein